MGLLGEETVRSDRPAILVWLSNCCRWARLDVLAVGGAGSAYVWLAASGWVGGAGLWVSQLAICAAAAGASSCALAAGLVLCRLVLRAPPAEGLQRAAELATPDFPFLRAGPWRLLRAAEVRPKPSDSKTQKNKEERDRKAGGTSALSRLPGGGSGGGGSGVGKDKDKVYTLEEWEATLSNGPSSSKVVRLRAAVMLRPGQEPLVLLVAMDSGFAEESLVLLDRCGVEGGSTTPGPRDRWKKAAWESFDRKLSVIDY